MSLTTPRGYDPKDMIYAKVIADSYILGASVEDTRLTTVEVRLPRMVLAELNTHRRFSRNSASSRAIPVARTLAAISEAPFMPIVWASEKKGMQGGPPLEGDDLRDAQEFWIEACEWMLQHVTRYIDSHPIDGEGRVRLHKSLANRLLEPFMWHTVIISSTEWENFYDQRCSPLAQPEFRVAAEAIRDAISASTPRGLNTITDWHLPYTDNVDMSDVRAMATDLAVSADAVLRMISVARVCRVSYMNHDGVINIEDDVRLYRHLVSQDPPHWSPMEHIARPKRARERGVPQPGNFSSHGWVQLRHILSGEVANLV